MKQQQKDLLVDKNFFRNEKINHTHVFNKFISLINLFLRKRNRVDKSNTISRYNKEIIPLTPIQIRADEFFAIKDYDLIETMVKNGYELLPHQNILLQQHLEKLLTQFDFQPNISNHHHTIEQWLELGITLNETSKKNYFEQRIRQIKKKGKEGQHSRREIDFHQAYPLSFFYTDSGNMFKKLSNGEIIEHPLLTSYLKQYAKENSLFNNVFTYLINNLIDNFNLSGSNYSYTMHSTAILLLEILTDDRKDFLLKEINFDSLLQVMTNFNNKIQNSSYQEIKDALKYLLNTYYQDNINDIISNVKEQYNESYIEKTVIQHMKEETQHITIANLPNEAKEKLKEIHILYRKIHQSNIKPTETELYNVNNLFEKRIPEILKRYLTIDEQYQTTLTNTNGKNAQELMIDSLVNIYSNFNQVWENINSQAVSSLSATNKYTQHFKK